MRAVVPAGERSKGLIAWLKGNGDKATQGITGAGTTLHIAGVSFKKETGTTHPFVSYKGGAPAIQDLVAGQIDFMIEIAANAPPQVKAGNLKAYAVTAKGAHGRRAGHPDGRRGRTAGPARFHLVRPVGAQGDAEGRSRQAQWCRGRRARRCRCAQAPRRAGLRASPREEQTPGALATRQKADIERWWPVIRDANIKVEPPPAAK